jgi:hypothetical protein
MSTVEFLYLVGGLVMGAWLSRMLHRPQVCRACHNDIAVDEEQALCGNCKEKLEEAMALEAFGNDYTAFPALLERDANAALSDVIARRTTHRVKWHGTDDNSASKCHVCKTLDRDVQRASRAIEGRGRIGK